MKTLYLGGARSGKSRLAEQYALSAKKRLLYVATGEALDTEMADRIQHHKARRDDRWFTIEEPLNLASVIEKYNDINNIILIDCMTLWLSNCMHNQCLDEQKHRLMQSLEHTQADIVLVSNEVGSGIVPLGELSRNFADQAGWLNQELAQICNHVHLVVAGMTMNLKSGRHH